MSETLKPDICVIGGGPGGIALAEAAANLAVPVVLVEKAALGGADLAVGSAPTKALRAAASAYETLRRGPAIGVSGAPIQVNLPKLGEHIRATQEAAAAAASPARLAALGVTVIAGEASFVDRATVAVGETRIRARRFVIATGSVPAPPLLPGLAEVETMTVAEACDVTRKAAHLLILGADARGLELAQSWNRLGVDTTVIDTERALAGMDQELVAPVVERLRAEGVRIRDGAEIAGFARRRGGVRVTIGSGDEVVDGTHLLVVSGRAPNVAGLGLDAAGVAVDAAGVKVDRRLRTTNRRVYAIGDVVAGPASASRAQYQAGRALRSILFRTPAADAPDMAPSVVWTDPMIATVGLSEAEAQLRHKEVRILRFPFAGAPLAEAERAAEGMVKAVTTRRGAILGAAAVGRDAAETIAIWSLAISAGLGIADVAGFTPPVPSRAEASRRAAAAFDGPGLAPQSRRRMIEFLRKFG